MPCSHDQILALRSEADDSTDSPEVPPLPFSRILEESEARSSPPASPSPTNHLMSPVEPVNTNEPAQFEQAKKVEVTETIVSTETTVVSAAPPEPKKQNKADAKQGKIEVKRDENTKPRDTVKEKTAPVQKAPSAGQPTKAGSKRKFGAEAAENLKMDKPKSDINKAEPAKPLLIRDNNAGKTLKELASMRREKDRLASAPQRKPLSAKSTNDDVSVSPKKATTAALGADAKPLKNSAQKQDRGKERPEKQGSKGKEAPRIEKIDMPPPEQPILECIQVKGEPSEEPALALVSPMPLLPNRDGQDTPPPADISLNGEMSRPNSRRSRPAISYAEPNLRVKMRRPTKEMCDAVAGEGKSNRRGSQTKAEDHPAMGSAKNSNSQEEASDGKETSDASNHRRAPEKKEDPGSPLADKTTGAAAVPGNVVTGRKRRNSTLYAPPQNNNSGQEESVDKQRATPDPYDLNSTCSPDVERDTSRPTAKLPPATKPHARRQSAQARAKQNTQTARKRSSMVPYRTDGTGLDVGEEADTSRSSVSSYESEEVMDGGGKARGAVRRKSMML